ncbi:LysR substrate-binding domain-containing protein [Variovorax sp. OV700]|jgi:LysR family nitrogen assimilation transcriptional regulator|uniref:LysR substrate-binding domain-containing protein n=1 Tax=Variovorax sp. OV700 TaxID=1882826 RepID=UPI000B80F004|nr:LysR substrate-binding domain-containing protein [Variovorax sp. OV700]
MDERQLKYFLVTSEMGSVTSAADKLDIAQPSLSQMLLRLEEELGTKLFMRTSRGVVMTETGQVFREHALKILSDMRRVRDEIRLEDTFERCEVTVGLPSSLATLIGSRLVSEFQRVAPGAKLTLVEAMSGHIREWLTRGELDVGALYSAQDCCHLSLQQIAVEELFLVGESGAFGDVDDDGLAIDSIDILELNRFPLILPTAHHGLRRLVDQKIKRLEGKINVRFEIDSLTLIKSLVRDGHGYSMLAHAAISEELKRGQMSAARIVKPIFRRGVFVARNPLQVVTRASVKMAEAITNVSWKLIQEGEWLATRVKPPASEPFIQEIEPARL